MSTTKLVITILIIALGTMLTRFLPVLLFARLKETPLFAKRLQVLLPSAAIGLLVVYCFKDLNIAAGSRGLPELFSVGLIVVIHRLFKNTLLSIAGGTALYMFLVQSIF